MSDKLGKDESIARVYQFLSNYGEKWKEDADAGKKDGVINQTEFRGFMLKNVNRWNGENKYDANDIITKFWNSIDTNTKGTMTRGYSNSSHLDNNEIENMEKNLQITKVIREYVYGSSKITMPDGLYPNYQTKFLESMQASLLNKATAYFASAQYDENNKTEFNTKVQAYLDTVKEDSYRIASADYYKIQAIENAGVAEKYGYDPKTDDKLESLIESYISTIKDNEDVNYSEIKTAIDTLVNDYLSTAGLGNSTKSANSSNTKFRDVQGNEKKFATTEQRLSYFGISTSGGLNDLQVKVLTKDLTEAITTELNKTGNLGRYNACKAAVDARIPTYAQEKVNSGKSFDEIKNNIATYAEDFITNELAEIERIANDEALNAAKTSAKTKVAGYNAKEEYKEAVKEVFGDDYNATIDACTTTEAIDNLVASFEAKIAEVDAKLAAEQARKNCNNTIDWSTNKTSWSGNVAMYEQDDENPYTSTNMADLYGSSGVISLIDSAGLKRNINWKTAVSQAKDGISKFTSSIVSSLSSNSNYYQPALNEAKEKVDKIYKEALSHSIYNWAGEGWTVYNKVKVDGQEYEYEVAKKWYNNSATGNNDTKNKSASNNQLGLRIEEQYDDEWFNVVVNATCVMDLFNKFYQEALK